jgi:hypothetical protein
LHIIILEGTAGDRKKTKNKHYNPILHDINDLN